MFAPKAPKLIKGDHNNTTLNSIIRLTHKQFLRLFVPVSFCLVFPGVSILCGILIPIICPICTRFHPFFFNLSLIRMYPKHLGLRVIGLLSCWIELLISTFKFVGSCIYPCIMCTFFPLKNLPKLRCVLYMESFVLDSHPSLACQQIHKICPYTIIILLLIEKLKREPIKTQRF